MTAHTTSPLIGLSSSAVYPAGTPTAFEVASRLGYDGLEVMVWNDEVSQNPSALARLSEHYQLPILALHAPCLLITQFVWGREPWDKLRRCAEVAHQLGVGVVVVHPPFSWQRGYAEVFAEGIAQLQAESEVVFAVENMYPWRVGARRVQAYSPSWNPVDQPYAHVALDVSHAAASGSDPCAMAATLGPRLTHVHLSDSTGSRHDEHLVPGRGTQPCQQLLAQLAESGFAGHLIAEVNTRRCDTPEQRDADLAESLAFIRRHWQVSHRQSLPAMWGVNSPSRSAL